MKRFYLFFLLSIWASLSFAAIDVKIEPQQATMDDTIRLTFTMNAPAQAGAKPSLLPLQKIFNIIGTQQSMSYSVTNGNAHAISQWVILLTAKQTGTFTIPAIQIGTEYSKPLQVEIIDNHPVVNSANDEPNHSTHEAVFLKTEVSNDHPFINEQIIYTVKLYHNQRLVDADYQPPAIENALLFPLGDGQSYQSVLDGEVFAVEEQQYAIFPQKSGTIKLVAPTFQALVYTDHPERVRAMAKTTELSVKPVPKAYTGKQWFPAKQVKLTEVYSSQDSVITQGNTLVRTVTLQAVGVPAQLLPKLTFNGGDSVQVYSEKPDIDNVIRQKELISKTVVKATYLFNQPGKMTIPSLSLKWFNTVTGKEEEATLPERLLTIRNKEEISSQSPVSKKSSPIETAAKNKNLKKPKVGISSSQNLPWLLTVVFALGWLITAIMWWLSHHTLSFKRSRRIALKRLEKACMQNQPVVARQALLHWATLQWPDANILNITDLARVVHDAALKKQLLILSHALYSQDGKISWRGDALWHSIVKHRATKKKLKTKGSALPPINPF